METTWNGFRCEEFTFDGQWAIVVFPDGEPLGKLVLKTEYWGAFPDVELRLVRRGYHLAFLQNRTRFATREDCDSKAKFVRFLAEKYELDGRCVPIGMSCGGSHAVRFAGFYPELVSCLYIDAPLLNYASFPGRVGNPSAERVWEEEFVKAYPGVKKHEMVHFSEHPLNMADTLVAHRVPILMVCGMEDKTVSHEENGGLLEEAFRGTDLLTVMWVPFRGHHPHGMIGDNGPIEQYILEHS